MSEISVCVVTQNIHYSLDQCRGFLSMICTNILKCMAQPPLLLKIVFDKSLLHGSVNFASDTMLFG